MYIRLSARPRPCPRRSHVAGGRPAADLVGDLKGYRSWYPGVRGIFLDEMSTGAGHESYDGTLSGQAKALGFDFSVGNPGTDTTESYVGSVDVILIYASGGLPAPPTVGGWRTTGATSA